MPIGWVTEAPIEEIGSYEVKTLAQRFRRQIRGYAAGRDRALAVHLEILRQVAADEEFNTVIQDPGATDPCAFQYEIAGTIMGMMWTRLYGPIQFLSYAPVPHPGAEGAMATMMEFLVTLMGRNGATRVETSIHEALAPGYAALGFAITPDPAERRMRYAVLDPAKARGLWSRSGTSWTLSGYAGKRHAGVVPPPAGAAPPVAGPAEDEPPLRIAMMARVAGPGAGGLR
jgi:hypothetical protein